VDADSKPCPVCGETIKSVALKCRFCNTDLQAFAAKRELETEKPLFSGHPAAIRSISAIAPFAVLLIAAVLIGYQFHSEMKQFYVGLCFATACCLLYLWMYLASRGIRFTITTQRVKVRYGLLSQTEESLELFRIDHFELDKPISWRLFGHASLRLYSSDMEFERFRIYAIPDLETLAETLRECQLRERVRRGLTTFVKA
jgi:membrane protein YdbS with pleckstrin-like domain